MIPEASIDVTISTSDAIQQAKTYKIMGNRIQGYIDGKEALQQAIYKMLNTEKYEYPIYDFSFGIELENLIGKDPLFVQLELSRRITECLLTDERIEKVENFAFDTNGDSIVCSFDVTSIYGQSTIKKEVTI